MHVLEFDPSAHVGLAVRHLTAISLPLKEIEMDGRPLVVTDFYSQFIQGRVETPPRKLPDLAQMKAGARGIRSSILHPRVKTTSEGESNSSSLSPAPSSPLTSKSIRSGFNRPVSPVPFESDRGISNLTVNSVRHSIIPNQPSFFRSNGAASGSNDSMRLPSEHGSITGSTVPQTYHHTATTSITEQSPQESEESVRQALFRQGHHSLRRNGWYDEVYVQGGALPERYCAESIDNVPYWYAHSLQAQDWETWMTSLLFLGEGSVHGSFAHTPSPGRPTPPPIPKRVLDLGCGSLCLWSIITAAVPGWEKTQFVGLDIAPPNIPTEHIPTHIAERLTYVQHNFLNRLPFEDGAFDCVRMAFCGAGLPEHRLDDVVTEVTRILSDHGVFEVFDNTMTVLRRRKDSSKPSTPVNASDITEECINAVLERRFINPHAIRTIAPVLCVNLSKVLTTGHCTVAVPSPPIDVEAMMAAAAAAATAGAAQASQQVPADPELGPKVITISAMPALQPLSSSTIGHAMPVQIPRFDRMILAAEADRLSACSYRLAHEGSVRRLKDEAMMSCSSELTAQFETGTATGGKQSFSTTTTSTLGATTSSSASSLPFRTAKLRSELLDSIQSYCSELRQQADLARILSSDHEGWGWKCRFDEQALRNHVEILPILDRRIQEEREALTLALQREHDFMNSSQSKDHQDLQEGKDGLGGGSTLSSRTTPNQFEPSLRVQDGFDSASVEMRLAHARFAKRETEAEIIALQNRLGLLRDESKDLDQMGVGELGFWEAAAFVATKRTTLVS